MLVVVSSYMKGQIMTKLTKNIGIFPREELDPQGLFLQDNDETHFVRFDSNFFGFPTESEATNFAELLKSKCSGWVVKQ